MNLKIVSLGLFVTAVMNVNGLTLDVDQEQCRSLSCKRGGGGGGGGGYRRQCRTLMGEYNQGGGEGPKGRAGNSAGRYGGGYGYGQHTRAGNGAGNVAGNGFGGSKEWAIIQDLIDARHHIKRTVANNSNGVETMTTSDKPEVSEWIFEHVTQMMARVESGRRVRQWDDVFVELFDKADEIQTSMKKTDSGDGVIVDMQGTTKCGISLAQAHAKIVSSFIDGGREEVHKGHSVEKEWGCSDEEREW
jgi:hypothetical protein